MGKIARRRRAHVSRLALIALISGSNAVAFAIAIDPIGAAVLPRKRIASVDVGRLHDDSMLPALQRLNAGHCSFWMKLTCEHEPFLSSLRLDAVSHVCRPSARIEPLPH